MKDKPTKGLHSVAFGNGRVEFLLRRSQRKTLAITVRPDKRVVVTAPRAADVDAIRMKVRKRAPWILQQVRYFERFQPTLPPRRYVSGETHRYLGRQYRLKVKLGHPPGVKLIAPYLHVATGAKTKDAVRHLLEKWFREKARESFIKRLKKWSEWCIRRKLPEPKLHLRTMPKRWGSSHPDGRIYLNPELIHAPAICVDYVIAHEVCHLKHPNHDRAFFRLLDSVFPQRERVKQQLEESKL